MIIWHRNRRGRGGTTPRSRSRNIANNTFSEGWLQKSNEFAGLRTAPATHHAKNTAKTTFSCGMLQNAGFGTIPCGGGGGGSEPRTGIIYICLYELTLVEHQVTLENMIEHWMFWKNMIECHMIWNKTSDFLLKERYLVKPSIINALSTSSDNFTYSDFLGI